MPPRKIASTVTPATAKRRRSTRRFHSRSRMISAPCSLSANRGNVSLIIRRVTFSCSTTSAAFCKQGQRLLDHPQGDVLVLDNERRLQGADLQQLELRLLAQEPRLVAIRHGSCPAVARNPLQYAVTAATELAQPPHRAHEGGDETALWLVPAQPPLPRRRLDLGDPSLELRVGPRHHALGRFLGR